MAQNRNSTQHSHIALQCIQHFTYMIAPKPHETEINFLNFSVENLRMLRIQSPNTELKSSRCQYSNPNFVMSFFSFFHLPTSCIHTDPDEQSLGDQAQGFGCYMISLGVKSEENGADSVGFSSVSLTESNQREGCVVFECRQLTLVRGGDTGHRPGVKPVSREEIASKLILALTDVLIQNKTISLFWAFFFLF